MTKKNAAVAEVVTENELTLDNLDAAIGAIDLTVLEQVAAPETTIGEELGLSPEDLDALEIKSTVLELQAKVIPDEAPAGDETIEDQASEDLNPDEDQAPAEPTERAEMPSYQEVLDAIPVEDKELARAALVTALDARMEFELLEKANDKIIKALKGVREKLAKLSVAGVFRAQDTNPDTFNRVRNEGSRYNVYAIQKVEDLCRLLLGDTSSVNAINRACIKSLFKCQAAGVPFNLEMARYAASDKYRISPAISRHLTRYTVGVSTAPTQASSTMQALVTMGIVSTSGSVKNPVYTVIDSPASRKLKEVVSAL